MIVPVPKKSLTFAIPPLSCSHLRIAARFWQKRHGVGRRKESVSSRSGLFPSTAFAPIPFPQLYLDFINTFQFLLALVANRKE